MDIGAEGGAPIAALAEQLGYASESAFSTAFKRVVGAAPGLYRRAGGGGDNVDFALR